MSKDNIRITRKSFLKGLGATAVTSWLPGPALLSAGKAEKKDASAHRILSCNIRVALPRDEEKGVGWNARKDLCIQVIQARQPGIICLQEVIRPQMADLEKGLPGFSSFGFSGPAMDAYPEGYHGIAKNPIMFSADRYILVATGSYWLSETPLMAGSLSWGSARPRHVNWVRLKDRTSQQEFRVLNTHLDHISQHARKQQVRMIMEESGQYPRDFPQLLAGDFNQDASNAVIDIIKEGGWIENGRGWTDTYTAIHGPEDPGFTAHGFLGENKKANKGKIDFIFARGKVQARDAEIIKDNRNGVYPSDHYFVSADVVV